MKIRKCLIIFVVLLFLFAHHPIKIAFAEEDLNTENSVDEIIAEIAEGLDLSALEEFLKNNLGDYDLNELITSAIKGESFSLENFLDLILEIFKNKFQLVKSSIISILAILLVFAILSVLQPDKGQVNEIIFMVSYCFVGVLVFTLCANSIKSVSEIITNLAYQTEKIFPVLLSLISIVGANSSLKVFQPTFIFVSNAIVEIILRILLPIVSICGVLSLISAISEKFTLKKLMDFFIDLFKWIIGITLAIFSIFTGVKGLTAGIYDNFSLQIIKYTVGNSFPLIGSFAKEGVDVFLVSGVLIKNAVGLISIIVLFFALIAPFLELALLSFALKLLSAFSESFSDTRITHMLNASSKVISLLSTLLVMFFVIMFILFLLVIKIHSGILS